MFSGVCVGGGMHVGIDVSGQGGEMWVWRVILFIFTGSVSVSVHC